jgi:hypothetical protein
MNIVLSILLGAASFTTTYEDGIQAYDNENFAASITLFEELVYNRVYEPEVFYNLGNAYYRSGYLAPAIANYERALMLDPSLESARTNLQRTVSKTNRALAKPAPGNLENNLYFWHGGLTVGTSMTAALVLWSVGWLILVVRVFRPKKYMRRVAGVVLILSLVFMGSWWIKANSTSLAVANGNRIPVRYGNKPSDTIRFELFEGDRVFVDEQKDVWVRVVTADGERGWARQEFFITVWPPSDKTVFTQPSEGQWVKD